MLFPRNHSKSYQHEKTLDKLNFEEELIFQIKEDLEELDSPPCDSEYDEELNDNYDYEIDKKINELKLGNPSRKNSNDSFKNLNDFNNCLSNDLIQKLEQSSPVKSIRSCSDIFIPKNSLNCTKDEKESDFLFEIKEKHWKSKLNDTISSFGFNQGFCFYNTNHCPQNQNKNNINNNLASHIGGNLSHIAYPSSNLKSNNSRLNRSAHSIHPTFNTDSNSNSRDNQFSNYLNTKHSFSLNTKSMNISSGIPLSKTKSVIPFNNVFTGKKGWFCNGCKNFNFESNIVNKLLERNKCNRCLKDKTKDEQIITFEPVENNNNNKTNNYSVGPRRSSSSTNLNDLQLLDKSEKDKAKKTFAERPGDWTCFKCKNINFAFRKRCNRCPTLKKESEELALGLITVEESPFDSDMFQNNDFDEYDYDNYDCG